MSRPNIGRDLLNVPMGDMIRDMAFAIADAQIRLDSNSVEVAQMMGGLRQIAGLDGSVAFEDSRVFFGKEKMTTVSALDILNSTSDLALKATIKQALGIPGNTNINEYYDRDVETTAPTTGDSSKYYKLGSGPYEWKIWRSTEEVYEVIPDPTRYVLKSDGVNGTYYVPTKVSMLELGFTPTFYQFVDTIIEVKINISFTESREATISTTTNTKNSGLSGRFALLGPAGGAQIKRSVSTSQVNASFSSKFSYTAEGSSLLRTKLTPIPPPAILEERIRDLMEMARENETTNAPTA